MARFNIVGGPGKWDLMLALFDQEAHPTVTFELEREDPKKIEVSVVGVEDGAAESWWLHLRQWPTTPTGEKRKSRVLNARYSTRTREGWIRIADPKTTERVLLRDSHDERRTISKEIDRGLEEVREQLAEAKRRVADASEPRSEFYDNDYDL
jgi:hypothetical protein